MQVRVEDPRARRRLDAPRRERLKLHGPRGFEVSPPRRRLLVGHVALAVLAGVRGREDDPAARVADEPRDELAVQLRGDVLRHLDAHRQIEGLVHRRREDVGGQLLHAAEEALAQRVRLDGHELFGEAGVAEACQVAAGPAAQVDHRAHVREEPRQRPH